MWLHVLSEFDIGMAHVRPVTISLLEKVHSDNVRRNGKYYQFILV